MPLLTTEQAAALLQLHPVTLRDKARLKEVPAIRLGGRWRFDENVLREWLASGCPRQTEQPSLFEGAGVS